MKLKLDAARFNLGQLVATPDALEAFSESFLETCLNRHISGDWGDLDEEDQEMNNEALTNGDRLLSAYKDEKGTKVWIITEWDRSTTTVLLPENY